MRTFLQALAAALLVAAGLIGSGAVPLSGKTLFEFGYTSKERKELFKLGETRVAITRKQPHMLALRADRSMGWWLLAGGVIFLGTSLLTRKRP